MTNSGSEARWRKRFEQYMTWTTSRSMYAVRLPTARQLEKQAERVGRLQRELQEAEAVLERMQEHRRIWVHGVLWVLEEQLREQKR